LRDSTGAVGFAEPDQCTRDSGGCEKPLCAGDYAGQRSGQCIQVRREDQKAQAEHATIGFREGKDWPASFRVSSERLNATVHVFDYDTGKGQLKEKQSISGLPPGVTGRIGAADLHLTHDGKFLYISERTSNTLTGFKINSAKRYLASDTEIISSSFRMTTWRFA
jgi:hypothetical protein